MGEVRYYFMFTYYNTRYARTAQTISLEFLSHGLLEFIGLTPFSRTMQTICFIKKCKPQWDGHLERSELNPFYPCHPWALITSDALKRIQ